MKGPAAAREEDRALVGLDDKLGPRLVEVLLQQLVASYEGGRRRLPVALLPALAQHLAVSVEALLGLTNGTSKRGPTPKFQRHLEQLSRLPRARQRFVLDMLETVLQQASR